MKLSATEMPIAIDFDDCVPKDAATAPATTLAEIAVSVIARTVTEGASSLTLWISAFDVPSSVLTAMAPPTDTDVVAPVPSATDADTALTTAEIEPFRCAKTVMLVSLPIVCVVSPVPRI